jgi:hypothetical protein
LLIVLSQQRRRRGGAARACRQLEGSAEVADFAEQRMLDVDDVAAFLQVRVFGGFGQSAHLIRGFSQTPGTHSLAHAGA